MAFEVDSLVLGTHRINQILYSSAVGMQEMGTNGSVGASAFFLVTSRHRKLGLGCDRAVDRQGPDKRRLAVRFTLPEKRNAYGSQRAGFVQSKIERGNK